MKMPRGPEDGVGARVMIWSIEVPEPKRWCTWANSLRDRHWRDVEDHHAQVESVRPTIGESDTESVYQSTADQSGDEDITRVPETVVEDVLEDVEVTRATQAVFLNLDSVDLTVMFKTRAIVMRSPPKFLRGACKSAMRVAMHEWEAGEAVQREARKSRAWKLFVLWSRMLYLKPPRVGEEQNGGYVQVLQ